MRKSPILKKRGDVLVNKLIITLLSLSLSACASNLSDIRSEAPNELVTINGNYDDLGSCTVGKMQTSTKSAWKDTLAMLTYQVSHDRSSKKLSVTGYNEVYGTLGTDLVLYLDLIFSGKDEKSTTVELRWGRLKGTGLNFGSLEMRNDLWAIVNSCSGMIR